jgi:exopolyphosphatase/guanosine-5'-triphosphate,3'-diphosphate pyrophosphatase
MTAIVPRWEWRTFGHEFGTAEVLFASLERQAVQESDEVYLRSGRGAIVKIRAGLMDVKALQDVNADGLEQWFPVMKESFPLAADVVAEVLAALEVARPELDRDAYTMDQFLEEVVGPHPEVTAVPIRKRRSRYIMGGCMTELTDLDVDGRPTRTIAIESEDPEAVVAAIVAAGLTQYLNHNFVRGLTALLEDEGVRYSVIDVGTNSVKFHVGEQLPDRRWRALVDRAEVTRLGEGLEESGRISADATTRTADAIAGMVAEAREHRARAIAAVGTAGLRMAQNSDEVIAEMRRRAGVTVEVISGEEESRLAYLAVKAGLGLDPGSLVVFDTGGGSTQFTFGSNDEVLEQYSLNVGAVRYTERFGLDGEVTSGVLEQALAAIAEDLGLEGRPRPEALVGMGGTMTNITAVSLGMAVYDPDAVQGATLDLAEVARQIERYRTTPLEERRSIIGLQPKRAEVILAGACIVKTVMEKLGHESLTVSDRGLRHGLLNERFGP